MAAAIDDVERVLRARTGELVAAVRRFHDILIAHLDREEELVVPVFLALTPREAWNLIHGWSSSWRQRSAGSAPSCCRRPR